MSFAGRVGFVTMAGVLAAIATNVSYWNWYGFPTNYTAAYMLIQVVGFFAETGTFGLHVYYGPETTIQGGPFGRVNPNTNPLQYFFVLRSSLAGAPRASLFPGFALDLANQPYFLVRQTAPAGG